MATIKKKTPSSKFSTFLKTPEKSSHGIKKSVRGIGSVDVFDLKVSDIVSYEKQARKIFKDDEIKGLADSIKEVGMINPIQVIKSGKEGQFTVVNGERRLRAAQSIGMEKLPCIIIDRNDKTELVSVIDNIQRQDLHPVEMADAFSSLVTSHGDKKKLSEKLGIQYKSFVETLKLSTLPLNVKQLLLDKDIRNRDLYRELFKKENTNQMLDFLNGNASKQKSIKKQQGYRLSFKTSSDGKIQLEKLPRTVNSLKIIDEIIDNLKEAREIIRTSDHK